MIVDRLTSRWEEGRGEMEDGDVSVSHGNDKVVAIEIDLDDGGE